MSNSYLASMRAKFKAFADEHAKDFCASFDIDRANQMLPKGNAGAETNSLDKAFIKRIGKLEHLPTL